MHLICPVCGNPLQREEKTFRCSQGHSFDVARQGYVNLLTSSMKHSASPGDSREQVQARRAFLEAGYYAPIARALADTAAELGAEGPVLDIGCGEGYYSSFLARSMQTELIGVDISREAVRCAAGRHKDALWVCATAAHIPVEDHSAGLLTSLFALTLPGEYRRLLKPDGLYFQVLAAEDHLLGLKNIIYPELIHREKNTVPELEGFTLVKSLPIRFDFHLEGEQVRNLLYMTPHVYRIGKEGADRLRATEHLDDTASCVLNVYRVADGL